jgi:transketolase
MTYAQLEVLSNRIRLEVLNLWQQNGAPLAGALSFVDIYTVLFFRTLALRGWDEADWPRIIPKSTAANALYATLIYAGYLPTDHKHLSPVVHRHDWPGKVSGNLTKNLGQGIGLAFSARYVGHNRQVIACLSEGDLQAGAESQAKLATAWGLNNLTVIVDCNGLQSRYPVAAADPTAVPDGEGLYPRLKTIWESCGWEYREVHGHNFAHLERVFGEIGTTNKPLIIIAKTLKGKGVPFIERDPMKYTHTMSDIETHRAIAHLRRRIRAGKRAGDDLISAPMPLREGPRGTRAIAIPPCLPSISVEDDNKPGTALCKWVIEFQRLNPDKMFVINTDNPAPFESSMTVYSPDVRSPFLFAGVNESLALNVARGIANAGHFPVYTSPATHLQGCAGDWMHCVLDQDKVLMVGVAPGTGLAHWGDTHNSNRDCLLFGFPGGSVFQPASVTDTLLLLSHIYSDPGKHLPAYLRLPRRGFGVVDSSMVTVGRVDGAKNGFYCFRRSSGQRIRALFISSGAVLGQCLMAARELNDSGVEAGVINVLNLTHVAPQILNMYTEEAEIIVSTMDGDSSVLTMLMWRAIVPAQRPKLHSVGVDSLGATGRSSEAIYKEYGIDSDSLARFVRNAIQRGSSK